MSWDQPRGCCDLASLLDGLDGEGCRGKQHQPRCTSLGVIPTAQREGPGPRSALLGVQRGCEGR